MCLLSIVCYGFASCKSIGVSTLYHIIVSTYVNMWREIDSHLNIIFFVQMISRTIHDKLATAHFITKVN